MYLCKNRDKMRLNKKDIQSIVRVAKEIYGEGVEV